MNYKSATLLSISLFALVGGDCQQAMPEAPMGIPLTIADGAYGGPVLSITKDETSGQTTTGSGYRVVEIVGGIVHNVRIAPDKNGPFGCWLISPGTARTISQSLYGLDGNAVQTVIQIEGLSFNYSNVFSATGSQGSIFLSGQGSSSGTIAGASITWSEESTLSGTIGSFTNSSSGTLSPIGALAAVPTPEGMNGLWKITYPNTGIELVEIRGLRVVTYYDAPTGQPITNSAPVVGASTLGANVFFSFSAVTSFQSDPTPRNYSISFTGTSGNGEIINGTIVFKATGVSDKSYSVTIERIPADSC